MQEQRFIQLADAGYNRIPVYREVFSDLDTPLSVYLKLVDGPNAYLLESVTGGEHWGRYSIIGLPCETAITVRDSVLRVERHGEVIRNEAVDDPLAEIERIRQTYHVAQLDELPAFCGGLVGYFGYDTIGYIEPRLAHNDLTDEMGLPDVALLVSEQLAVFDNLKGKLYLIVNADPSIDGAWYQAQRRLDQLEFQLRSAGRGYPETIDSEHLVEDDFDSGFNQSDFMDAVRRCKDYIVAGDIMQVVLSQRLTVPFRARPVDVYRALRSLNPSPYMYFLDLMLGNEPLQVVGSSPEILMKLEGRDMTVRPIAGTRPRGNNELEDQALEAELLADPKELAEHLMLVDLGRNDLGRIAETGSVSVTEHMGVERYSHVIHLVSEVRARLKEGLGPMDLLKASLPAGTLSGAPKIRAMEIIAEIEPVRRGVYAGAVGHMGWWGDSDLAIAIRTAVIRDRKLHVQAGAGIVADSDPEREWDETMNKGRALFRAVSRAVRGL